MKPVRNQVWDNFESTAWNIINNTVKPRGIVKEETTVDELNLVIMKTAYQILRQLKCTGFENV